MICWQWKLALHQKKNLWTYFRKSSTPSVCWWDYTSHNTNTFILLWIKNCMALFFGLFRHDSSHTLHSLMHLSWCIPSSCLLTWWAFLLYSVVCLSLSLLFCDTDCCSTLRWLKLLEDHPSVRLWSLLQWLPALFRFSRNIWPKRKRHCGHRWGPTGLCPGLCVNMQVCKSPWLCHVTLTRSSLPLPQFKP